VVAVALRRERWIIALVPWQARDSPCFICAELAHQITEARVGVATLAALTKTFHIAAAAVACVWLIGAVQRRRWPEPT
jgi:hypothetical protein